MTDFHKNLDVTIRLVTDDERLAFLPRYFGKRLMIRGETRIYSWMSRLAKEYDGGFWNFYEVSNGGFFMAPANTKALRLTITGNGFNGVVSADAAGIVATLFSLCDFAMEEQGTPQGDKFAERYHFLRDYAICIHAEALAIARAID